jgi:hypothetical protein
VERSPLWREISKNHLSVRTAAFFCYGDDGANEEDGKGMPKHLEHPEWFDAKNHPMRGEEERNAYLGQVWQCRYSAIGVPDALWNAPCSVSASLMPTTRWKTWSIKRAWRRSGRGHGLSQGAHPHSLEDLSFS